MMLIRTLLISTFIFFTFSTTLASIDMTFGAPSGFVGTSKLIGAEPCDGVLLGRQLANKDYLPIYSPEQVVVINEAKNEVTTWDYLTYTDLRSLAPKGDFHLLIGSRARNSEDLKQQNAIHIEALPEDVNELYASVSTGIDRSDGMRLNTFEVYADRVSVAFRLKNGNLISIDLLGDTDFGNTILGDSVGLYSMSSSNPVKLRYLELNFELVNVALGGIIQTLGADNIVKTYFVRRRPSDSREKTDLALLTQNDLVEARAIQEFFYAQGVNKPMEFGVTPYNLGSHKYVFRKQLPVPNIAQAYRDFSE